MNTYSKIPRQDLYKKVYDDLQNHNGALLVLPQPARVQCHVCKQILGGPVAGVWEKATIQHNGYVYVLCEKDNWDEYGQGLCRALFEINPLAYE